MNLVLGIERSMPVLILLLSSSAQADCMVHWKGKVNGQLKRTNESDLLILSHRTCHGS